MVKIKNSRDLWLKWRGRFGSANVAIAAGIYVGNRWAKSQFGYDQEKFYNLKDQWIQESQKFLVNGAKTRAELGKGVLYVHWFNVEDFCFSLHSYQCPQLLLDGWAENKVKFGSPLTPEEVQQLENIEFDFKRFVKALRFGFTHPDIGGFNPELKAKYLEGFNPPEYHPIQAKPPIHKITSKFSSGDIVIFTPSVPHPYQSQQGRVLRALNAGWVEVHLNNGYKTIQNDSTLTLVT